MRKIFIDGGANKGQSTDKFLKYTPDSNKFEVYMFEPQISCKKYIKDVLNKYKDYNINYLTDAIWKNNDELEIGANSMCTESASVVFYKQAVTLQTTKSIHLSKWIRDNFDKDDYIILKLDIEGAEYEVIEDLYQTDTLSYINEFHGEVHGTKKGYNINDDLKVIEQLKKYNLFFYNWNGSNDDKGVTDKGVRGSTLTLEKIEGQHKKWETRGNAQVKPNWKDLEQYKNDYDGWYNENME